MLSTEAFLALAMQCAASVHPSTSLDVARAESGLHPYAIAEIIPRNERQSGRVHVISHYPSDKPSAIRLAKQIAAKGRRYSVGLMQITSTNFHQYGVTAADLFSPCTSLSVFERILTDCWRRGDSLKRALSCYYAGDFETGQKPEAAFSQTSYLRRIGYTVPGTRQDSSPSHPTTGAVADPDSSSAAIRPRVVWPGSVVRGVPSALRQQTTTRTEGEKNSSVTPPAPRTEK
ncbi:lytic transglycosylase domain-containing protein [Citrobacter amalonaticus]|uniref:lytic transglycosylase domain-containing protein n=1 Tax=Citrobacter amalonaticus TaxID=35703 RepID=UPI001A1F1B9C|nr:lytic transglycosylase domain-containing protein [Citrobacter amalonaticus]HDQ2811390.1 lytic transglycosylase domain-containing protein [Citrobacter amalonaticus]